MMICRRAVVSLSCAFWLVGCYHNVDLTVHNSVSPVATAPSLDISVVSEDENGAQDSTTKLGTASPSQSVHGTFKVKKNGSYIVKAYLSPSGPLAYSGGAKTVAEDTTDDLKIDKLSAPTPDVTDTSTIQQAFGALGPEIGFNPVTLRSALTSLYGGLVIYEQPQNNVAPASQPTLEVDAASFTGAVQYADFVYPTTSSTKTIDISTDASAKAAASVPLWGSLTANFSSNSVYKLNWDMEGFGNVIKADASTTFQDKLAALSDPIKTDICQRLTPPNTVLLYVNQMYVVRSAILSYQQGQAVSAGAAISGGSIISGSAAYDFSSSGTQTSRADEQVVNIAGPSWTKSNLSFCSVAPPAAIVASKPNGVPVEHVPNVTNLLKDTKAATITFQ